jgi:hypothetical protein
MIEEPVYGKKINCANRAHMKSMEEYLNEVKRKYENSLRNETAWRSGWVHGAQSRTALQNQLNRNDVMLLLLLSKIIILKCIL